jgi:hypothetical protein
MVNHPNRSKKLTPALIRAMAAVRGGKVTRVYTSAGNTFRGPAGIAPGSYRRLEVMKYIEDAPGQRATGVYASHFKQQLSAAGIAALEAASNH